MNAGNVGEQYGRTRDEIRQAAMGIRIRDAIGVYRNKAGLPTEFSYSLETGKHYDADNAEDRTALLERYSDGHSPVYMIAVTNAVGTINDEIAALAAIECAHHGLVPFLGRWVFDDVVHEDVSVAMDHGLTDEKALGLFKTLKQKGALKITRSRHSVLYNTDYLGYGGKI
ncbi:MAG: hypothetical protein OXU25_02645 [Thaumarchaeota archaeon]|nr:hypothetical protein [Nitrososphaerota archaeon]